MEHNHEVVNLMQVPENVKKLQQEYLHIMTFAGIQVPEVKQVDIGENFDDLTKEEIGLVNLLQLPRSTST